MPPPQPIPMEPVRVFGDLRLGTSGSNGCLKANDGTALTGMCASDLRLKTEIRPLAPLLDRVVRLSPVSFRWRAKEFPEMGLGEQRNLGLIAQEVEEVLPELVGEETRGYRAVKYHELPIYLLQAIRELKAENDKLRDQVGQLEVWRAATSDASGRASGVEVAELRQLLAAQQAQIAELKAALRTQQAARTID